jgi:hypothetical protein
VKAGNGAKKMKTLETIKWRNFDNYEEVAKVKCVITAAQL